MIFLGVNIQNLTCQAIHAQRNTFRDQLQQILEDNGCYDSDLLEDLVSFVEYQKVCGAQMGFACLAANNNRT